jgi:hypothetical protein
METLMSLMTTTAAAPAHTSSDCGHGHAKRFNAQRAARAAIGMPDGREGFDFVTMKASDGWRWYRTDETKPAGSILAMAAAIEAPARKGDEIVADEAAAAARDAGAERMIKAGDCHAIALGDLAGKEGWLGCVRCNTSAPADTFACQNKPDPLAIPDFLKRVDTPAAAAKRKKTVEQINSREVKSPKIDSPHDTKAGATGLGMAPTEMKVTGAKLASEARKASKPARKTLTPSERLARFSPGAKAPAPSKPKAAKVAKASKTGGKKTATGPSGKAAECLALAARKGGVSPAELNELTKWKGAPWKWLFENPKGNGWCQRWGYSLEVLKGDDGVTRYKVTKAA